MTFYRFDSAGWYAGTVDAETCPESATPIDPEVQNGGPAAQWDGGQWVKRSN